MAKPTFEPSQNPHFYEPVVRVNNQKLTRSIVFKSEDDLMEILKGRAMVISFMFRTADSLEVKRLYEGYKNRGMRVGLAIETDFLIKNNGFVSLDSHMYRPANESKNWDPATLDRKGCVGTIAIIASATITDINDKTDEVREKFSETIEAGAHTKYELGEVTIWQTPMIVPDLRCEEDGPWEVYHNPIEDCIAI